MKFAPMAQPEPISVDDLSKQILADIVADFRARNLGTSDLSKGYVGPSIVELGKKYCADGSYSKVDFDLALKQLEESKFVDTGPMVPFENKPGSQLVFVGGFSKREFVYLTEKGYRAAQKPTAKPKSSADRPLSNASATGVRPHADMLNSKVMQPLNDAEREITKTVIQRFLKGDEATSQRSLLRDLVPFRASITEALRTLVGHSFLREVNNTYGEESYSPRAIAFHYCGDADALAFAKNSTEIVLRVVEILYERWLETDGKDQKPFTREDAELEARKIDPTVGADMIRVGLALAEEFGVFRSLQRNPQQIGVISFLPGQRIFELGNNPWENHIRQSSPFVKRTLEQDQSESSENTLPPYSAMGLEAYAVELDNRKIFLVHGHADETKHTVAKFLRSLGLEVIILHEQANQGQTIVEKFEKYADVGFAVVLLTPDDFGGSVEHPEKTQRRARQNVILELGIFIGKLGRKRVCPLYVEGVELPSDIHGVLYVSYDQGGTWRSKLMKELSAAGIEVNQSPNRVDSEKASPVSLNRYIKP